MANVPEIKYTSADFSTLLQELITEIQKKDAFKDTNFRSGLGRTLLELFAYTADQLHFYIRRLASESYISSAKVRNSMINLCKLISYQIRKPTAATTTLRFRMNSKKSENVTINQWTRCQNADGYEYITTQSATIPTDSTSVDIPAIQGKRVIENIGTSDGSENQSFPLTYKNTDTYLMNVYVGKEGYTIVSNWVDFYRKAKTYTRILHGRTPGGQPEPGDWIEETLWGTSRYKARITHNLDLVDPNLFNITAVDGTSYDGTQIYFVYVDPIDENTLDVYYDDNTTTMIIDIKDDLDTRITYPTTERRIENDSVICVVDYDDEDTLKVWFGDGKIGKIPRNGETIRVEYVVNDGEAGNTGKNSIVTIKDSIVTDVSSVLVTDMSVTNISEASGGADVEDLDDIRKWAPLETRSLKRMVTLEDYETLISRIPGVRKVQVLDVYNPGDEVIPFRMAKIYVIPVGGGKISPTLKKRIEDEIDSRKIVGTVRTVNNITYDEINVTIDLWYQSGYTYTQVKSNLLNAINSYFSIDHETREIGENVDYENMLLILTDVEGVGSITLYLNSTQLDITIQDGHYPTLGSFTVNDKGELS